MTKFACLGVAIAALAATPLLAQPAAPAPTDGPMTRVQMQQMVAQRFAAMDTNHDGFVTEAELSGVPQVGANAAAMVARLDTDKDGKISLAELSARQMAMFDAADTNHDGIVSPEEREAAMRARMQQQQQPAAPQGH